MKNMLDVLENVHKNKELRRQIIPCFMGDPGLGKTQIITDFVKNKLGVDLVPFIASQRLPNEISGISMPVVEEEIMKFFDYDTFLKMKDGDVLFLDELPNAQPMVLNAMLTLLEERQTISGRSLADIMIVAAGNYQGATVMTPQQKQRFIWYDVEFNKKMWALYLYEKFGLIDTIIEQLCSLIESEAFATSNYNYFTPRSIVKNIELILHKIPTPYSFVLLPILENTVNNNSENDIKINNYIWKKNEKISWLNLKRHELKIE